MITLRIDSVDGRADERVFESDDVVIGRSSSADLCISDRSMSRRHARVFRDGGEWQVEDLGSHNGTLLNGSPLDTARRVALGDQLTLGGSRVSVVRIDGASAPSGPETGTDGSILLSATAMLESVRGAPAKGVAGDDPRFQRYAERMQVLNQVHEALGRSLAIEELLELILDGAFRHLRPQHGAIYLRSDDRFVCAARRGGGGDEEEVLRSRHLIEEVAEKGMAALVLDTATDERFQGAASLLSAGVRSLVAAPLLDPEGSLGMIFLSSSATIRQFTEEDLELLVSLASVAAMRLRNLRLAEVAAERQQLAREIALARQIQIALLPQRLPEIPGYALRGATVPSRGVSGDFWEAMIRGENGECVLLVVDVSGKGIVASLLTAAVEALSAGPIEAGLPPAQVFTTVSRLLHIRTPAEKFATAVLAVLEPESGVCTYSNAGHNPPLVVRSSGAVERLAPTGTPLGMLPGIEYGSGEVVLEPGDLLAIYSDGITEAADPDDEEYGAERLAATLVEHRNEPLARLAGAVEGDLERFVRGVAYADDRTLVLLRREV